MNQVKRCKHNTDDHDKLENDCSHFLDCVDDAVNHKICWTAHNVDRDIIPRFPLFVKIFLHKEVCEVIKPNGFPCFVPLPRINKDRSSSHCPLYA